MNLIRPPDEPYPDDLENPFISVNQLFNSNTPLFIETPPTNTKKRIVFCLTFVFCIIFIILIVLNQYDYI